MHVITVMNTKGGVGKTLLSTYLAVGLAARGHRVLFLDSDAQANATTAFSLKPEPSFYNLLANNAPWGDLMVSAPASLFNEGRGKLYVVRGNYDSSRLVAHVKDVLHLRQRLQDLKGAFQYCVIDTQPSPTPLHLPILAASESVLIPTVCEAFSAQQGIPDAFARIEQLRDKLPLLMQGMAEVQGIVPNKYRKHSGLHRRMVQALRKQYGDLVWEPLPLRAALSESQFQREFIYKAAPSLGITKTMWQFVDRVIEKTTQETAAAGV
jgi:chromosome partitioning protein